MRRGGQVMFTKSAPSFLILRTSDSRRVEIGLVQAIDHKDLRHVHVAFVRLEFLVDRRRENSLLLVDFGNVYERRAVAVNRNVNEKVNIDTLPLHLANERKVRIRKRQVTDVCDLHILLLVAHNLVQFHAQAEF